MANGVGPNFTAGTNPVRRPIAGQLTSLWLDAWTGSKHAHVTCIAGVGHSVNMARPTVVADAINALFVCGVHEIQRS